MEAAAAPHPEGSIEAVAAIGQAYVDFARSGPGVFRLVFGLTEGHEEAPELHDKGSQCYDVVIRAAARCMGRAPDDPIVLQRTYMLWACVHGHSFLTIDKKTEGKLGQTDDWAFLVEVSVSMLGHRR
jgi:Tetracyclin repressor-like, C-terminal domain